MGKTIKRQGGPGAGQHTKMANQIMIAGTMTGLTEMLVYAKAAGLSLDSVLETVGAGSASNWSMANYAPRILRQDYSPGFFAKHFKKDLGIALAEAEAMGLDLPATSLAGNSMINSVQRVMKRMGLRHSSNYGGNLSEKLASSLKVRYDNIVV